MKMCFTRFTVGQKKIIKFIKPTGTIKLAKGKKTCYYTTHGQMHETTIIFSF